MTRPPALLFGVPIADLTLDETVDLIGDLIAAGRSRGRTSQIATVNVDFLVNALEDEGLREILQSADLCLADGVPIVWATKLLGMPVRQRVAGSDLVPLLGAASAARGWRVHFFGSSHDVAARARAVFKDRYPGARVSIDAGPVVTTPEVVDHGILDSLTAVDADVLCIALGNPKQEKFINAYRSSLGSPVLIGVGGSLDMLVGHRRRAPTWIQRLGLEWVVRALQEPRRLGRRYAHDIRVFGPLFCREYLATRRRRGRSGVTIEVADDVVVVRLGGAGRPSGHDWAAAAHCLSGGAHLRVQPGTFDTPDDASLAMLIGLVRCTVRSGGTVTWNDQMPDLALALEPLHVSPAMVGYDG